MTIVVTEAIEKQSVLVTRMGSKGTPMLVMPRLLEPKRLLNVLTNADWITNLFVAPMEKLTTILALPKHRKLEWIVSINALVNLWKVQFGENERQNPLKIGVANKKRISQWLKIIQKSLTFLYCERIFINLIQLFDWILDVNYLFILWKSQLFVYVTYVSCLFTLLIWNIVYLELLARKFKYVFKGKQTADVDYINVNKQRKLVSQI